MITLYGIPNCDTVRKARRWLDDNAIEYTFVDFREEPVGADTVERWFAALGWENVINRRSTTWKQLDPADRDSMDEGSARDAVLEHPTLVKRPVLDTGKELHVGFSAGHYQDLFKQHTL